MARAEAYLHAKFHLDPSNRLATVHEWHRQDRTDRQDRERTDSIGRTVLQTVAQKLTETYWLSWDFSTTDNFDLSAVSVFDKFVFESENGVLHLKDRFGSFVIRVAIIATANSLRIWRLLPRLNLEFSDFWPRKITALRMMIFYKNICTGSTGVHVLITTRRFLVWYRSGKYTEN